PRCNSSRQPSWLPYDYGVREATGRLLARSIRPAQEPPTEAIEAFAKDVVDFVIKRRMREASDA
ncbi:MAG TPA: hypothetical protein VGK11_04870, partial [Actinomycetota bacterium]